MKIGIVGGNGQLGKIIYNTIQKFDDTIEGIVIESTEDLVGSFNIVDVYIDCTTAKAFMQNYNVFKRVKKPLVIATTGFSNAELKSITELSKIIPIIKSPNFSVGAYKYLKIVKYAANLLGDGVRIAIVEKHHKLKKDRPSGTANEMVRIINEALPDKIVDVESIRLFDYVGEHELYFRLLGRETIEICHRIFDRESFASGAIDAAKWILKKENKLYSMDDLLK